MSVAGNCHKCKKQFWASPRTKSKKPLQGTGVFWAVCPHCHFCPFCHSVSSGHICPHGLPEGTLEAANHPGVPVDDSAMLILLSELTHSLFDADDKDVTFKLTDGIEMAHKVVLSAASDVFKSMLAHDMREKDGTIELDGVDRITMRVFLRMLYTGHVSEDDWIGAKAKNSSITAAPPLRVLLSALSLAKKYMCSGVRSLLTHAVKGRLTTLEENSTDGVFEDIMAAAIQMDIGPLRMAALEKAKSLTGLRKKYDSKQLSPEVQFELEAIWPIPSTPPKRQRVV